MLRLATATALVLVLGSAAAAQQAPLGQPNWIPGQSRSTITLYDQTGLRGSELLIAEPQANLTAAFRAESVRTAGGAWQICDHNEYRGQCRVVDGWTLSLNRDLGIRQVRSMRPVERPKAD